MKGLISGMLGFFHQMGDNVAKYAKPGMGDFQPVFLRPTQKLIQELIYSMFVQVGRGMERLAGLGIEPGHLSKYLTPLRAYRVSEGGEWLGLRLTLPIDFQAIVSLTSVPPYSTSAGTEAGKQQHCKQENAVTCFPNIFIKNKACDSHP